jgi:hypothetical protein
VGWRFAEWADLAADIVRVAGAWLLFRGVSWSHKYCFRRKVDERFIAGN